MSSNCIGGVAVGIDCQDDNFNVAGKLWGEDLVVSCHEPSVYPGMPAERIFTGNDFSLASQV